MKRNLALQNSFDSELIEIYNLYENLNDEDLFILWRSSAVFGEQMTEGASLINIVVRAFVDDINRLPPNPHGTDFNKFANDIHTLTIAMAHAGNLATSEAEVLIGKYEHSPIRNFETVKSSLYLLWYLWFLNRIAEHIIFSAGTAPIRGDEAEVCAPLILRLSSLGFRIKTKMFDLYSYQHYFKSRSGEIEHDEKAPQRFLVKLYSLFRIKSAMPLVTMDRLIVLAEFDKIAKITHDTDEVAAPLYERERIYALNDKTVQLNALFSRAQEIAEQAPRGRPPKGSQYKPKVDTNVRLPSEVMEWLESKSNEPRRMMSSLLSALMEADQSDQNSPMITNK